MNTSTNVQYVPNRMLQDLFTSGDETVEMPVIKEGENRTIFNMLKEKIVEHTNKTVVFSAAPLSSSTVFSGSGNFIGKSMNVDGGIRHITQLFEGDF